MVDGQAAGPVPALLAYGQYHGQPAGRGTRSNSGSALSHDRGRLPSRRSRSRQRVEDDSRSRSPVRLISVAPRASHDRGSLSVCGRHSPPRGSAVRPRLVPRPSVAPERGLEQRRRLEPRPSVAPERGLSPRPRTAPWNTPAQGVVEPWGGHANAQAQAGSVAADVDSNSESGHHAPGASKNAMGAPAVRIRGAWEGWDRQLRKHRITGHTEENPENRRIIGKCSESFAIPQMWTEKCPTCTQAARCSSTTSLKPSARMRMTSDPWGTPTATVALTRCDSSCSKAAYARHPGASSRRDGVSGLEPRQSSTEPVSAAGANRRDGLSGCSSAKDENKTAVPQISNEYFPGPMVCFT